MILTFHVSPLAREQVLCVGLIPPCQDLPIFDIFRSFSGNEISKSFNFFQHTQFCIIYFARITIAFWQFCLKGVFCADSSEYL